MCSWSQDSPSPDREGIIAALRKHITLLKTYWKFEMMFGLPQRELILFSPASSLYVVDGWWRGSSLKQSPPSNLTAPSYAVGTVCLSKFCVILYLQLYTHTLIKMKFILRKISPTVAVGLWNTSDVLAAADMSCAWLPLPEWRILFGAWHPLILIHSGIRTVNQYVRQTGGGSVHYGASGGLQLKTS